ncbi:MAG: hypothetical protein M3Z37_01690, partial [Candidatus Eremiobacteraeota bacterium]|nr:hypothetical protein [Candidatus Eremiobacteraeota bacterium]
MARKKRRAPSHPLIDQAWQMGIDAGIIIASAITAALVFSPAALDLSGLLISAYVVSGCLIAGLFLSDAAVRTDIRIGAFFAPANVLGFTLGGIVAAVIHVFWPHALVAEYHVILGMVLLAGCMVAFRRTANLLPIPFGRRSNAGKQSTIVVGSGKAAAALIRAIEGGNGFPFNISGFVDDEPLTRRIDHVSYIGPLKSLRKLIAQHAVDTIIVAVSSASSDLLDRVTDLCTNVPNRRPPVVKILPDLADLLTSTMAARIRDVRPEDLLHRHP